MIEISTLIIATFYFMWNCCSQECYTKTKINLLYASFIVQFTVSMRGFKVQQAPPAANICANSKIMYWVDCCNFDAWNDPSPPPTPPLMSNHASKFWRAWLPLWNAPSSRKSNTHFLKKHNILFPTLNKNTFEYWNMNIQSQNLKIKGDLGVF